MKVPLCEVMEALDTLHGEDGVSAALALLPAGDCVPLPLGGDGVSPDDIGAP